jgi:hypothetical protein
MSDVQEHLTPEQAVAQEEIDAAFRALTNSYHGKRVLYWILEQCEIYVDPFCGEHTNSSNYKMGAQSSGRKIIARMDRVDPKMYPQLLMDIAEIRVIDKQAAETRKKKAEGEFDDVHED